MTQFERGDIVLSVPGSPAVYVITGIDLSRPKNIYDGLNLTNHKTYHLCDSHIGQKVGTATAEFLNNGVTAGAVQTTNHQYVLGQRRAEAELALRRNLPYSLDRDKWEVLAKAKPGDWLTVHFKGEIQRVQFVHVLEKGQKYIFTARTVRGAEYRWPLNVLVTQQAPKRPEQAIIEDLRSVNCRLSPENVSCDGELPVTEIARRHAALTRQRAELVRELGREPKFEELYPDLASQESN
jgi:hypothetical protein